MSDKYFWLGGGKIVLPDRVVQNGSVLIKNDKIIAEVYPDTEFAAALGIENIEEYLNEKIKEANKGERVEREISVLRLRETPFPKTTTGKIKRSAIKF